MTRAREAETRMEKEDRWYYWTKAFRRVARKKNLFKLKICRIVPF